MSTQETLYYAVNDRPVMLAPLPDGGMDALVFDWATGAFIPDRRYFGHVSQHGNDVDQLTEQEFRDKVRELRRPVSEKLQATPIKWERTGDGEIPFRTTLAERALTIRVNDFPAEPLYTVLVDGQEIDDLEDWPGAWVRPETPADRTNDSGERR